MGYTLYGSQTSPFVRRVRLLLGSTPYDFKELNPYEGQDAIDLHKINPINKIPVFTDGNLRIWDSRQIFNYLNSIHRFQNMDWEDENQLTAIEEMMNAGVALMQLKRSGINIEENFMFIARQKDRVQSVLEYLKPYMTGDGLTNWNFHTMSIYSYIEWDNFRNISNLENNPVCQAFLNAHKDRPVAFKTQIPRI